MWPDADLPSANFESRNFFVRDETQTSTWPYIPLSQTLNHATGNVYSPKAEQYNGYGFLYCA